MDQHFTTDASEILLLTFQKFQATKNYSSKNVAVGPVSSCFHDFISFATVLPAATGAFAEINEFAKTRSKRIGSGFGILSFACLNYLNCPLELMAFDGLTLHALSVCYIEIAECICLY